jgi:hypothetical protein
MFLLLHDRSPCLSAFNGLSCCQTLAILDSSPNVLSPVVAEPGRTRTSAVWLKHPPLKDCIMIRYPA